MSNPDIAERCKFMEWRSMYTPLNIETLHGNVTLPLDSPTNVGELNRQRCKVSSTSKFDMCRSFTMVLVPRDKHKNYYIKVDYYGDWFLGGTSYLHIFVYKNHERKIRSEYERKIRTGFAREDPSTYSVGLPEEYDSMFYECNVIGMYDPSEVRHFYGWNFPCLWINHIAIHHLILHYLNGTNHGNYHYFPNRDVFYGI